MTGSVQAGMLDGLFAGVDILIINHVEDDVTMHTVTDDDVRPWVVFSFGAKTGCEMTVPGSGTGFARLITNGGSKAATVKYGSMSHSLSAGATIII